MPEHSLRFGGECQDSCRVNSCCHWHIFSTGRRVRFGRIPVGVESDAAGRSPVASMAAPSSGIGVARGLVELLAAISENEEQRRHAPRAPGVVLLGCENFAGPTKQATPVSGGNPSCIVCSHYWLRRLGRKSQAPPRDEPAKG